MLKLGETQTLTIAEITEHGAYLTDEEKSEEVLLPGRQIPEGAKAGGRVEVFLYRDSEDRLIATTKQPKLHLHEVGWLTVAAVNRTGAFLDWGLDKDLLLPYHEQPRDAHVKEGEECLAAVYIDKSGRLCATMNVCGNFGMFVAVDDCFSALIPKKELVRPLRVGETISARVTRVRPDGKLDLSLREKAMYQMDSDCGTLLRILDERGGKLPFTDKADPERIREEVHMSKSEFKRAVGHLMKEGRVKITPDSIERI